MSDDAPATTHDDARDGRWLTYDQFAAARQITRRAAIRLTQRRRLRRQPGNGGSVLVLVPHDMLTAEPRRPRDDGGDVRDDVARADGGDDRGDRAAFETALAAIEASHASEVEALRQRADTADVARLAAQGTLDRVLAQLADAGERAEAATTRAEAMSAERERLAAAVEEERQRADNRVAIAQQAVEEADRLREEANALAEGLRIDLAAARDRLGAAQAAAEAAVATEMAQRMQRRGRGLMRRLRDALRGE